MKKLHLPVIVLLLLQTLVACVAPTPAGPQATVEAVATATPVAEADIVTLDINLFGEPPTVDPAMARDATSILLDEQLFLGLTDYGEEAAELFAELATRWSVSDDGLVWTFQMRQDVPWVRWDPASQAVVRELDAQGNPRIVNAHDVVYGVKRTLNPETGSDYAYVLYIIAGAADLNTAEAVTPELLGAVGVRAVDDFTVEFTLETPAGYFPGIASMWVARPMPQWAIEANGEGWVEPGMMVSNGPYVMTEWLHHDRLTMVRNPYWSGWQDPSRGNVQRIEFTMIEDSSTEFAMYEADELDLSGVPLVEMDRVKTDALLSTQLEVEPALSTFYIGFTMTKPPVDNVLVRKALSAAIDRQTLIDHVLKGGEAVAHSFAPPGIFGNVADDPTIGSWMLDFEQGKELAQQWMAEAGYPGGENLRLLLLYMDLGDAQQRMEAIQAMWSDVFPKASFALESMEWGTYLQTLSPGTPVAEMPHLWILGWSADYADQNNWVHEVFSAEEGQNAPRAQPGRFEELTRQAKIEADPEQRKALYREAERLLVDEEARIAPLVYARNMWVVKPWLEVTFQPLAGDHLDKWSIDWQAKKAARGEH